MESGSYKELQSKRNSSGFLALLIATVTIALCLLIGIGCWILVAGNKTAVPVQGAQIVEEITILRGTHPGDAPLVLEHPAEIDFQEGTSNTLNSEMREEIEDSLKQEEKLIEEAAPQAFGPNNGKFIQTLVELSNNVASEIFNKFSNNERFAEIFGQFSNSEDSEESHNRQRRSIPASIGLNALKYLNYLTFGKYMFNEVYSITEYTVEGRKLAGDADAFFLDNGFWATPQKKKNQKITEKSDSDDIITSIESKPNRIPSAFDDGWTPMVNKVSLKFITDMLTTLLNLMREYLMRDNVMECLWFMFCKDMNHQAKYTDPMGYLARVNSVGLKVLTDKEGRETDTIQGVWQALTKWEPLHCDSMFPKCDGPKALEIVNEVANASRK